MKSGFIARLSVAERNVKRMVYMSFYPISQKHLEPVIETL